MKKLLLCMVVFLFIFSFISACGDDDGDAGIDGDASIDGDDSSDGDEAEDGDAQDGDVDGDVEEEAVEEVCIAADSENPVKHEGLEPPPPPANELCFEPPVREPVGDAPTPEEITAFTKKVMAFFKDTDYFNWVWRTSHGLHESYDPEMFHYKLWWQGTSMRKNGDTIEFLHHGTSENITKRTIKVMSNAAAAYLMTGDERMAQVAASMMRGIVALSLGMEFESEDPIVKYLQARAVFNHNHSYEVDGRKVFVDYSGNRTEVVKWNVHVFEITDNPEFGDIWISNMRSKDDVPYMFESLPMVARAYHESENQELRDAAELYIEYLRGFSQSIVDNDWQIMTKYKDGEATIAVDTTKDNNPPADLGSFVHWERVFGEDAECTAQLACAMTAYGYPAGKGDCDSGKAGWTLEKMAANNHFFNYNIYNYFHISALATAQYWGYYDIASSLMEGLVYRFEQFMHNPEMANTDHKEAMSDLAGWLLEAATHGYPLNAEEARHIMKWYGDSSDWYRPWEHWDPWTSMEDGAELSDFKAPRDETLTDEEGNEYTKSYMRLVEMPYIFEYCYSPIRSEVMPFIDCDIVADPSQWGE